ncbi:MAG: iron-containing alcohol dehydrogenase, partial [Rhodobacterales bacterium]|nr:iron-containing alcohol dehydrogenase [Rhodobacterales bacterium]
ASLQIPEKLSGLGVSNVDITRLTEAALKDPSCGGNPVELTKNNVSDLIKNII